MTVEAMVNDRSGISESWSETELLTWMSNKEQIE